MQRPRRVPDAAATLTRMQCSAFHKQGLRVTVGKIVKASLLERVHLKHEAPKRCSERADTFCTIAIGRHLPESSPCMRDVKALPKRYLQLLCGDVANRIWSSVT